MISATDSFDTRAAGPAGTVSPMPVRITDVLVVEVYPFAPDTRVR